MRQDHMWAVFKRTFKSRRVITLVYTLAGIGFLLLYISLFPSIKAQSASLEQLLKAYPDSLMKAFNIDLANYVTIGGYISSEMFSFIWPLILFFMVIGYAGGELAGEVRERTIEVTLSQPVSRLKIYFGKYLCGLFLLAAFNFLTILSIPLLLAAFNIDYQFSPFLHMSILGLIFGLAVYSFAFFLSAIFYDKGKVYFISGGLLVVMYVFNIIASLKENLKDFHYLSFFYYFNANNALLHSHIDHLAYWVFLGVTVASVILGAIIFQKRDF